MITDGDKDIFIMPFNIPGLFVYHTLKRRGVEVSGFFDNDTEKQRVVYDCKQISPPPPELSHASVIICNLRFLPEMQSQLFALGYSRFREFNDIVQENPDFKVLEDVFKDELQVQYPPLARRLDFADSLIAAEIVPSKFRDTKDKLVLNQVVLSITQKCTLKCKNCNSLMQYYKKPVNLSFDEISNTLDIFFETVDFVSSLLVSGGEVFLHPKLLDILKQVMKFKEKIGLITIVTNGTIMPPDGFAQAVCGIGIIVAVSDYGKYSLNLNNLKLMLERSNIKHQIMKHHAWQDTNKITSPCANTSIIQSKFDECTQKKCNVIQGSRFYKCPFAANATNLKAVPFHDSNFIEMLDDDFTKERLRDYINNDTAMNCCAYCSGSSLSADKIPVAEQCKAPVEYTAFH